MNRQPVKKEGLPAHLTQKQLSLRAQQVLQILSNVEIETIQRDNPFQKERNEAIYKLRERGVKYSVLVELTNLTSNSVKRIVLKGKRYHEKEQTSKPHDNARLPIRKINNFKKAIKENPLIDEFRAIRDQMGIEIEELREIKNLINVIIKMNQSSVREE